MDLGQVDLGIWDVSRLLGFVLIAAALWLRGKAKSNWKSWQKATGPIKPSLDPFASPVAATFDGLTGCSLAFGLNLAALVCFVVGVALIAGGDEVVSRLVG